MNWLEINKFDDSCQHDVLMWFSIGDGHWQKGYKQDGIWYNYLNEPLTEFQLQSLTHFCVIELKQTA